MAKLAMIQVQPKLGDKEHNLHIVEKAMKSTDASVLMFPEMFLTGYTLKDKYQVLAETMDGRSVKKLSEFAKDNERWIIVGMPEVDNEKTGIIYNSAVVIGPDQNPSVYRKMILANFGPFEESHYFGRGDKMPIFKTPIGKIGVEICFDIFFPEISKVYALAGADIIACISASPSVTKEFFEKIIVARAIENTVFVAYTNLIGTEQNMTFWGGSRLIGPRGELKAGGKAYVEGLVNAEFELSELDVARQFRPTLKETRFDVLERLVAYAGNVDVKD
jgi:predicted amidohydrolase